MRKDRQLNASFNQTESGKAVGQNRNEFLARLAWMLGLAVGILGALVLVAYGLKSAGGKSVFPGLTLMTVNTALGLLLCGVGLAILPRVKVASAVRPGVMLVSMVVMALATLTLSENLFGWDFGIDRFLSINAESPVGSSHQGRMSAVAAFCFILTGASLLVSAQPFAMRLRRALMAALGLALIVVSGMALVGYASDVVFGVDWLSYTGMPVHTAASFVLFGFALLALGRSEGELAWSLDRLTTGGFALGIVSLLAAAAISYLFTNRLQISAAWVSHTQEVLKEIGGVATGVASLGGKQRNYINTGDDRLLEQDEEIKSALHQKIEMLRQLTSDNPRQQPRIDQLAALITQRIDWGEQTIATRRQEGLSSAERLIAAGNGITLSENIRRVIKQMEDEEYSLLDLRQAKERSISTTTFLLLPLGAFLSVTLLFLGLFFLNAGMGERAQALEKAAWLATFPEHHPSPIVELDLATGVIQYSNPFASRLLPEIKSQGLQHPWLVGLQEAALTLVQRPDEPVRREIQAGGRFFTQTINYIPETKRMRVYGDDITERKGVEAAAARLAAIVESSDDAIIGKDLQGVVTSWNAGAERLFGYQALEMVGQPIMRLIPQERQQEEEEILKRVKGGQNVRHFDTERVRKDGSMVAISVTVSPIKDSTGKIIGASKVARDISERKQAQEALRETQARLHSTLAAGSIGTWTWDIINDRLVADEFTARLFSIEPDAAANGLPAEAYLQAVFEEDRLSVADALARAIKSCGHYDIEYRVRQESGELRWLKARGRVDSDGAGSAVRFHGAVIDITDLKRTEGRIRRLIDSDVQGVMFWNSKGEITAGNDAFLRIVGYTREDLEAGRVDWAAMTPPEYAHLDRRSLEELAATGVCTPFEKEFSRKDGSRVPILLGAAIFEDSPDEGVCFVLDITERKQVEKARWASEARYRTLFDYAPDGIVISDPQSVYLDANASLCRMLGFTRDELIGLHASDIVDQAEIQHIGPALGEIKANSDHHREWRFRRKDGSVFPAEVIATMMPDGNLMGMIRDITERKLAQEKIHQMNIELEQRVTERTAQLEAANKELEAFSYSVSHDLRAPLRAVDGFSQAVLEDYGPQLPQGCRQDLQTIRQGAQKMGELIDDLLTFSRLSRLPLSKIAVDTGKLVRNVLEELSLQRAGRQIDIRIGDLPRSQADPALLKQVWINLLSNALKYTGKREAARVEIGCAREKSHPVYFVRDNGTGFDMKYAHKLFGVFQRLHRAEDYEGTGVGLAIVQRVIHRHGGRVWAEAAKDLGATFYFTLEGETNL